MCDLIDFNSPDPRRLLKPKLASPLIPGPETPPNNNIDKNPTQNVDFVSESKRSSLDNNPFDKVYKETAEYIAKKDDPFETVLEKARENAKTKHDSEIKEDFTPRRRRHSDLLKMNKTMEEPLLQGILNKNFNQLIKLARIQDGEINVVKNLNKTDLLDNKEETKTGVFNSSVSPNIVIWPPSPGNCSVLNQSAMNDSLSESSGSSGNNDLRDNDSDPVSKIAETAQNRSISNPDDLNDLLKPSTLRRSFSQGAQYSTEKETQSRTRSRSIIETLQGKDSLNKSVRFASVSSTVSSNTGIINKAFIESGSISDSESFDVSRISGTPKLYHQSLGSMNSLSSYNSKNRAFILDSQSSSRFFGSTSTAKSSLSLSSISKSTGNFLANTPLKTPVEINDLELRFAKVKVQPIGSVGGLPLYSPNRKVKNFLRNDGEATRDTRSWSRQEPETRLIDTDVLVPPRRSDEDDLNLAQCDSVSNCSSDSVFIADEKVNRSVFREAKLLARTFDELAHQSTTNSFSSGEDLLYSRPRWNFDVLPVSDDEEDGDQAVVDNLIELPGSPSKNEAEVSSNRNKTAEVNEAKKSNESEVSEKIRELEAEFIDQDVSRNKVKAVTLLLDLEKIVHRENNPEAITLLENLEKVLGVKYENNSQLLATCMQWTNNLSKSPKKSVTKLGSKENIRQDSLENSHEDNNEAGLSESVKNQKPLNDDSLVMNLNSEDKEINKSEKSLITAAEFPPAVEAKEENLAENSDNPKPMEKEEKGDIVAQTEALELITNLSKILGGRENDSSPLSLLSNLRQVLNLATNQLNFENSQATKSRDEEPPMEIQREKNPAQKKPFAKPKADQIKSGRKRSSDSSLKDQNSAPVSMKRSMSFGSGQRNFVQAPVLAKEKLKSQSKSFKKALSCDTVPKPDTQEKSSTKVPEAGRTRASSIGGTGKYKLKKKSESETVTAKKGPLKALIPVGNMQRRGSMSAKVAPISLSRTPPKSSVIVPSTFTSATSSTPNPTAALTATKTSPKVKPVASSTPDGGATKNHRMRIQFSKSRANPKFSCNISPVTPLAAQSITSNVLSKGSPKNRRHNKTLSPPKRRGSQEAQSLNTTLSSIPKFSPLAGFSRRNSKETIKTLETSGSPKTSVNKSQTPKKSPFVQSKNGSQIPQSPLKPMNSQNSKFKPFNLISKLRRGSNGSSDKENCA